MSLRTSSGKLLQHIILRNRSTQAPLLKHGIKHLSGPPRCLANDASKFRRLNEHKFRTIVHDAPNVGIMWSGVRGLQTTAYPKQNRRHQNRDFLDNFNAPETAEELNRVSQSGYEHVSDLLDMMAEELVDGDRFNDAVDLVKAVAEYGIPMSSDTFSLLLNTYVVEEKVQDMVELVQFMHSKGYQVRGENYFHILRLASLKGSFEIADICFRELRSSDEYEVSPGILYNLLLNAYFSQSSNDKGPKNWDRGVTYFQEMVKEGIKPSEKIVESFLRFSVRCGTIDQAKAVVRRTKMFTHKEKVGYCKTVDTLNDEDRKHVMNDPM